MTRAIEEAYKTHIMQHKFPFTALFIEVPTYMVDVNVHPAKREFRFDDEKGLFHAVFHAVKDALTDKVMIPDMEAEYKVAPVFKKQESRFSSPLKNENIADSANENTSAGSENRFNVNNNVSQESQTTQEPNDSSFSKSSFVEKTGMTSANLGSSDDVSSDDSDNRFDNKSDNTGSYSFDEFKKSQSESSEILKEVNKFNTDRTPSAGTQSSSSTASHTSKSSGADTFHRPSSGTNSFSILESLLPKDYIDKINNLDKEQEDTDSSSNESQSSGTSESYEQIEMTETRFLSEEAKGHHKIVGQVFKTYWITEFDGSMYIMDQHAAHEKVNYETFLAEFKERRIHSQNLFPPEVVALSSAEKTAVLENEEYLKQYGFEIEDFGGNDIKLSTMPANLIGLNGRDVFTELASYLSTDGLSEAKKEVTEDIFVRKLATMGCKAAIKGNQEISEYEVKDLLDKLMKLKDPYTCPHGRPTLIKMTKDELDKKFKRIVE